MTKNLLLDWAVLAVSLFNTILLAWLGITVLLNSDRRRWGIWLSGGGLLLGALFFVSHTAVLGQGLLRLDLDSRFYWWLVAMVSAITLPFIWYVVMLWYAGYWEDMHASLHRRQRPWLLLTAHLLLLGIGGSIFVTAFMRFGFTRLAGFFAILRGSKSIWHCVSNLQFFNLLIDEYCPITGCPMEARPFHAGYGPACPSTRASLAGNGICRTIPGGRPGYSCLGLDWTVGVQANA